MLKSTIKYMFRLCGFEVTRSTLGRSTFAQFHKSLEVNKVNLIFDVGANTGQFGCALREGGYKGHIVSFEPLSSAHCILLEASKRDVRWHVAPRVAIGANDSEIEINISNNSVSSSILSMLDSHAQSAPNSKYVGSERVLLRTLDAVTSKYISVDSSIFIKIDTQGYEDKVLSGAQLLLEKAVGLQVELSLIPLYKNQMLFDELSAQLRSLGFKLWGLVPAFVDPNSGRLLQVDATFFRE